MVTCTYHNDLKVKYKEKVQEIHKKILWPALISFNSGNEVWNNGKRKYMHHMYTRWLPVLTLTILVVKYLYKEEEQERRLPRLPAYIVVILLLFIFVVFVCSRYYSHIILTDMHIVHVLFTSIEVTYNIQTCIFLHWLIRWGVSD